jgi:PAS domain S-box-containing protein
MDNIPAGAFIRRPGKDVYLYQNKWLEKNLITPCPTPCKLGNTLDQRVVREKTITIEQKEITTPNHTLFCDILLFALPSTHEEHLIGGIVMDVTEKFIAEKHFQSSRSRLRALIDTIPDLVWLKDINGVYLACNNRFEALFGASESEVVGKTDHDFVPEELADFFRKHDKAAMAAGKPTLNEEKVSFASDGHEEYLETIKAPFYNENGEVIGVLGIARDITERKQAEEELRALNERLSTAENIALIGNWEYRVSDASIKWSDELYRIFGLEPQSRPIDNEWLISRMHPDDRAAYNHYSEILMQSRPEDTIDEFRYRILSDEVSIKHVRVWGRVEYDNDGKPLRFYGTLQDVSTSEKLNQQLQSRLDELTRWQNLMLGREDRIMELKNEVNQLLEQLGLQAIYTTGRLQS